MKKGVFKHQFSNIGWITYVGGEHWLREIFMSFGWSSGEVNFARKQYKRTPFDSHSLLLWVPFLLEKSSLVCNGKLALWVLRDKKLRS